MYGALDGRFHTLSQAHRELASRVERLERANRKEERANRRGGSYESAEPFGTLSLLKALIVCLTHCLVAASETAVITDKVTRVTEIASPSKRQKVPAPIFNPGT